MTEKVFTGPLDRQLRDALSYIQNYIIKEKVTKVPGRAEAERIYNYPYAAVEEALSNAVYHKSYQIGEPITVSVTPDRMEITSLPGPDRTIPAEDIANRKMVSRRYRNRRIGDFLKELKLVEGRNTGIPTILRAMRQNGSELPNFETDDERTYLTVILPVQKSFLRREKENSQKTKTRKSVSDIKQLILAILSKEKELSTPALAEQMGYVKVTSAVIKAVRELMESGKIEYTEPDNPRSRNQKLRLTDSGRKHD